MLKICLLPRGGLPLSGSSERLKTLGVEKVEKMTLHEVLDTRVQFAMLELSVLLYGLLCRTTKGLSELSKKGEMHIEFPGSILVALHT